MRSKKLILITSGFPFGMGETFLETEIEYLCDSFLEVHILSVNPKNEIKRKVPENCEVSVIRFESGFIQKLKSLSGILNRQVYKELRIIKKDYGLRLNKGIITTLLFSLQNAKTIKNQISQNTEIDKNTIIYSYWCDDRALALALLAERREGIKTISRIHGWDVYFERSKLNYLPFRHFITGKMNMIYSISQNGIDYAVKQWKVDKSKFKLSRLGINNEHGPVIPKVDGVLRIVSCSGIDSNKRVWLIADALKQISAFDIEWTHVGDGPLRNELEDRLRLFPSNVSVNLIGRLPNKEVYTLYETFCPDLFINVSKSEGIPVSIMEAMSYGIPVIATNVGGNSEIVNETNGFLVKSQITAEELSQCIIQFDELQPEAKRLLSAQAFDTWKVKYNSMKNYTEFVTDLLSN